MGWNTWCFGENLPWMQSPKNFGSSQPVLRQNPKFLTKLGYVRILKGFFGLRSKCPPVGSLPQNPKGLGSCPALLQTSRFWPLGHEQKKLQPKKNMFPNHDNQAIFSMSWYIPFHSTYLEKKIGFDFWEPSQPISNHIQPLHHHHHTISGAPHQRYAEVIFLHQVHIHSQLGSNTGGL